MPLLTLLNLSNTRTDTTPARVDTGRDTSTIRLHKNARLLSFSFRPEAGIWADATAVLLGVVMTMCACGYEFGHGDHDSYLPESIHIAFPRLLANDWYTTHTLQYHSAFTWVAAMLMRLHAASPAFLLLYLALVVSLHLAWRSLVAAVGGSRTAYVASVSLWLLIDAGRSLAMYHLLQDSELLAANVASVAVLVGMAFWVRGRAGWAGLALGVAGAFHLNYAIFVIGGWCGLLALQWFFDRTTEPPPGAASGAVTPTRQSLLIGTLCVFGGSLFNIGHALPAVLQQRHGMPFADFLNVYVHFRHPHHYDPRRWSAANWAQFLWTVPPAVILVGIWNRRDPADVPPLQQFARRQLERIYGGIAVVVTFGIVFAGVWFVSATIVQLSLSRFAIYLHLFGCSAAAILICETLPAAAGACSPRLRWAFVAGLCLAVAAEHLGVFTIAYHHLPDHNAAAAYARRWLPAYLGLAATALSPMVIFTLDTARASPWPRRVYPVAAVALLSLLLTKRNAWAGTIGFNDDYPGELQLCRWVRDPNHTPESAIFLTSPADQNFCIQAQRAVVVSYKNPPQLTNELPAWRDRLCDVMGLESVQPLIGVRDVFKAMDQRYESLTVAELHAVATKYGARFVLLHHSLPKFGRNSYVTEFGPPIYIAPGGSLYLYRVD